MKKVSLAALVALIAVQAEIPDSPLAAFAQGFAPAGLTSLAAKGAPREEHEALDAQFAALTSPLRGAPDWAHDVLDWLWDLGAMLL